MIEKLTSLWDEPADARCITTNGFVKKGNSLVMGAGVAAQAMIRYPRLPKLWGTMVQLHGNHVFIEVMPDDEILFSFPVKHNWYEKADLKLIERSAQELMKKIDSVPYDYLKKVLLPLPGCGNGQLRWGDVKPVLEPILDDRVWVISNSLSYDFNPVVV